MRKRLLSFGLLNEIMTHTEGPRKVSNTIYSHAVNRLYNRYFASPYESISLVEVNS